MKILSFKMKVNFCLIFLFSCMVALCNVKQPFIAKNLLDYALISDYANIKSNIIGLLMTIAALLFFEFLRKFLMATYKKQLYIALRENVLKGLLQKDSEQFYKQNNQEYISLFNNDLRDVISDYYLQFIDILFDFFSILVYSFSLFTLNPLLSIIVISTNILPMIIPLIFENQLQTAKMQHLESLKGYNIKLGDVINGFNLIKTHRIENIAEKMLGQASHNSAEYGKRYQNINSISEMLIGLFSFINYLCIIIIGVYLITKGSLTAGGLLAVISVSELLVGPVTNVAYELNAYKGIKSIKEYIFNEYKIDKEKENKILCDEEVQRIAIKNLEFQYGQNSALKNINIEFKGNKKYLIYGLNGSGKSTLFKILAKLYPNYQGNILVNGKELRNLDGSSYYDKIAIVFQHPFMFNDTLKNNMTLFNNYSEEEIKNMIHKMGLQRIEADIINGKAYKDSENNISGGEIQKIALARVLLEQKKVIFLDEATSAFDAESSMMIESALLTDKSITIINISHKINKELIHYYDEIICLENGEILTILKTFEEKENFANNLHE